MAGEGLPIAVFRPFVVGGIKSLAFGLGYHGVAPDHFEVSFRDGPGAGFTPVPGLQSLAPGSAPARLAVSVHRLPWGLGAYMTEACDASVNCETANGGRRTLEQADSIAATGYFKAPVSGDSDRFGYVLALSGDGSTLAVYAPREASASTGTFAPGEAGYQAALDSNGATNSGAVTVYRRPVSAWSLEVFIKVPVAGDRDGFGSRLALSRYGDTLAVGAPGDDGSHTGTFALGGEGYQAALDSDDARSSGAAHIYRRSGSSWSVEAFVKAPKAGRNDGFAAALALSADGATLAVGAPGEDSSHTGTFALGGEGYQAALDSDDSSGSGAAYVYRRSGAAWSLEAFVKAPVAGVDDRFGGTLALSSDGATLAVGARGEASAATGAFAPTDAVYQAALDSDDSSGSGAAYVYRRSGAAWTLEAFVKAPKADADDRFGDALALSSDGATLAVVAPFEDSVSTGTFALGGEGYQAALDSDVGNGNGAVTVYRRSGAAWSIEAFVKAPVATRDDAFGDAFALSGDGATLAVGAPREDSSATGAFAPTDDGYQAALDSNGSSSSGAAYVYRRSGYNNWGIEAFVKAPVATRVVVFGYALALSGDGSTLAVGAPGERGSTLLQPVGGGFVDAGNAVGDSGAVYLY